MLGARVAPRSWTTLKRPANFPTFFNIPVMKRSGPRFIFVGILMLTMLAAAALTADNLSLARRRSHADEFQRLLGGLGLGPSVDLAGCPMCFDARASFACKEDEGALPGSKFLCRHHACSVLRYRPIPLEPAAIHKDGTR
ncbi:MAG: hypothetical protein FJ271_29300 [Planctomycetes bacterium]|nr:hypothetical protein [Planctomycetota bacterium]